MKLKFLRWQGTSRLAHLNERIKRLEEQMLDASSFVNEIEKGNFHLDIPERLSGSDLGNALSSMKHHLRQISESEEKRNWLNTGLATFSDILRNKKSLTLKDLADDILVNLVKYVGANQGAIFVAEEQQSGTCLRMIACYAYSRKKYLEKTIEAGEGLAGQCFLEKQPIFLKVVPPGYTTITSGLGEATPRTIFISPLQINEQIYGVIELASLTEFLPHHMEFVNKLSENIAATIKSAKESEQTVRLLNASQQQAEELRSQEEEMRQNFEEMQATQEEIVRKSDELNRAAAEMEGVLTGIDATMATIEFQPDGTIVKANANFLKTMKCSLHAIQGRHHSMFVPREVRQTDDYKQFWNNLANGQSFTGIFKRIATDGKTVWLNAIYNPIRDGKGKVVKVVKFATDISEQQEVMAQTQGLVGGINATMATIEFKPDGTILTANDKFLSTMKYSLSEIKAKHHKIFAPKEVIDSDEYQTFWKRLAAGESITGTFRRVASDGSMVWLNAIYNPIADAEGNVIKVVKFASDISQQQELVAQTNGLLDGINATMATIEFTPDGVILGANENFLNVMQYSLEDIKGKHHRMFVPKEHVETQTYQNFWKSLSKGEATTGTFERINSSGEKVILKAIYNPIKNTAGKVLKVTKLATEISGPGVRGIV